MTGTKTAFIVVAMSVLSACQGSGSETAGNSGPSLVSLAVTPSVTSIAAGAQLPLTATATYSDNTTKNLTSSATWSSSNTSVATVRASGVVASLSAGSATISASSDGITGSASLTVTSATATNSPDADGFLWGTEGNVNTADAANLPAAAAAARAAINDTLKIKHVKLRFSRGFFSTTDGGLTWSSTYCLPSAAQCSVSFDMDEVAKVYQANGWSMVPMFRHDESQTITTGVIDEYVNFVDWFLGRYRGTAAIEMIELVNAPNPGGGNWKGTSTQLVELTNKTYDMVKSKYPGISVGTPGFEYWIDNNSGVDAPFISVIEHFLDKNNGAKFDFWAFHGYALRARNGQFMVGPYPPTMTPLLNKYANITGILNIRAAMDANGWQARKIIDTEHDNPTTAPGQPITADTDALDTAYGIQELLLKRTLAGAGGRALSGALPMKIAPRGTIGEAGLSSLNADGSVPLHVKATALLWSKLKDYRYAGHVSGAFDDESQAWVEKFTSGNKELYIFFKPFKYVSGQKIFLDGGTISYTLNLNAAPSSALLTKVDGSTISISPAQSLTLAAENTPQFLEIATAPN